MHGTGHLSKVSFHSVKSPYTLLKTHLLKYSNGLISKMKVHTDGSIQMKITVNHENTKDSLFRNKHY